MKHSNAATLNELVDYALLDPDKRRAADLSGCSTAQLAQVAGLCEFRNMIERAPVTQRVKIVSRINRMITRVNSESSKTARGLANEWIALANVAIHFCPDDAI